MAPAWCLKIATTDWPGYCYPARPTPELHDAFEKQEGIRLPDSYREFASIFGSGELADHFRIYVPIQGTDEEKRQWSLDAFNKKMRSGTWLERLQPASVAARLYFFAATVGGLAYAWDIQEPASTEHHIYEVRHEMKAVA